MGSRVSAHEAPEVLDVLDRAQEEDIEAAACGSAPCAGSIAELLAAAPPRLRVSGSRSLRRGLAAQSPRSGKMKRPEVEDRLALNGLYVLQSESLNGGPYW